MDRGVPSGTLYFQTNNTVDLKDGLITVALERLQGGNIEHGSGDLRPSPVCFGRDWLKDKDRVFSQHSGLLQREGKKLSG